jgi:hypothetical protein
MSSVSQYERRPVCFLSRLKRRSAGKAKVAVFRGASFSCARGHVAELSSHSVVRLRIAYVQRNRHDLRSALSIRNFCIQAIPLSITIGLTKFCRTTSKRWNAARALMMVTD